MNANVTVNLTAPSGTTGDLNLDFKGTSKARGDLDYLPRFDDLSPGSQIIRLRFDYAQPGIYTSVPAETGIWYASVPGLSDVQDVSVPEYTLPTEWDYFRRVRFSQYNTPNEGATGSGACRRGQGKAWLVTPIPGTATGSVHNGNYKVKCEFDEITDPDLNSQFIQQTWINGTGISNKHGYLKNAAAFHLGDANHYGEGCTNYPDDAIGYGEQTGNTFVQVPAQVTGKCGELVPGESAAGPTIALSGVKPVGCNYMLNLDTGDHTTYTTRTITDICPDCNKLKLNFGADGHVDSYTGSDACTGHDVNHDLPGSPFYTSNITSQ